MRNLNGRARRSLHDKQRAPRSLLDAILHSQTNDPFGANPLAQNLDTNVRATAADVAAAMSSSGDVIDPARIAGAVLALDWNSPVISGALWTDRSGAGHNAVQASGGHQPTLVTAANGLPGLQFDGSTSFMATAAPVMANTDDWTIFFVGKILTLSGLEIVFSTGNLTGFGFDTDSGNRGVLEVGVGDFAFGALTSNYELWCNYDTAGVNDTCQVNGVPITSAGNISPTAGTGNSNIGSLNQGASNFCHMTAMAFYAYNRTLTQAEIEAVNEYVSQATLIF
jgi:hypothetical protein